MPSVAKQKARYPPVPIEQQILGCTFDHIEPFCLRQQFRDGPTIELAVGLRARTAHRRSLAAVEDAELDPCPVDRPAHDAVERIDLTHEMPLAETADCGIARHFPDRHPFVGQQ